MYAMTVNYPKSDNSSFDADYYHQTHMPLCARLLNDYGYQGHVLHAGKGAQPGTSDQSYVTVELLFNSLESLQSGLGAHGAEITGDVPNYTNVRPEVSFSEVNISLKS